MKIKSFEKSGGSKHFPYYTVYFEGVETPAYVNEDMLKYYQIRDRVARNNGKITDDEIEDIFQLGYSEGALAEVENNAGASL